LAAPSRSAAEGVQRVRVHIMLGCGWYLESAGSKSSDQLSLFRLRRLNRRAHPVLWLNLPDLGSIHAVLKTVNGQRNVPHSGDVLRLRAPAEIQAFHFGSNKQQP